MNAFTDLCNEESPSVEHVSCFLESDVVSHIFCHIFHLLRPGRRRTRGDGAQADPLRHAGKPPLLEVEPEKMREIEEEPLAVASVKERLRD